MVQSHRGATAAQTAEKFNAAYDIKLPEHTVHCSLLYMGLCSRRPIRVPMLIPVNKQKRLRWVHNHQNWTMEQWMKGGSSGNESCFLLYHLDNQVQVHCLPGEKMAPLWEEGKLAEAV